MKMPSNFPREMHHGEKIFQANVMPMKSITFTIPPLFPQFKRYVAEELSEPNQSPENPNNYFLK
jgi:hypothetical protein